MIRTSLIILFTINGMLSAQSSLEFISEKIDFMIDVDRFSVNGIYDFSNPTDQEIRQTILFPFPEDSDSVAVKRVYNLTYAESLKYKLLRDAIVFRIIVLPEDTVNINVVYSEKTRPENIYILKSTQVWRKPLKSANFSLTVDSSVKVVLISFEPDTIINGVSFWHRVNFYPVEDLKIIIK